MKLNDKEIRYSLISRLNTQAIRPKAIIEELRVHNGNAIADVVALYNEAHCYEIKGDGDKIERIHAQGQFYNLSFRKITLVTTRKHLEKALQTAPDFWGIMIAEYKNGTVKLRYIRKAGNNSNFDKKTALLTLWKDEMLNLLSSDTNRQKNLRQSRMTIAEILAKKIKKTKLSQDISYTLLNRVKFNRYNQSSYM
jgi:hypothetical protein